jgi:hypothetical protein
MTDQPISEKVILSAQVASSQRDRLAHLATVNERSLSGEVRRALDTYLRLSEPSPPHVNFSEGATGGVAPSAARGEDADAA